MEWVTELFLLNELLVHIVVAVVVITITTTPFLLFALSLDSRTVLWLSIGIVGEIQQGKVSF